MKIQRLNTIWLNRGNSIRLEFHVTPANVPLSAYQDIAVVIRPLPNATGVPVIDARLSTGEIIVTGNTIAVNIPKEATIDTRQSIYHLGISTLLNNSAFEEAQCKVIMHDTYIYWSGIPTGGVSKAIIGRPLQLAERFDPTGYISAIFSEGDGSIESEISATILNDISVDISESDGTIESELQAVIPDINEVQGEITEGDGTVEAEVDLEPFWYDMFDLLWIEGPGSVDTVDNELVCVVGDNIPIAGNDITEDYIPATSSALFTIGGNSHTVANLIDVDHFPEMPVKYDNEEPHHVRMIGVLNAQTQAILNDPEHIGHQDTLELLHDLFHLWIWWSGEWNDYGVMKANRPLEGPSEEPDPVWATYNFTHLTEEGANDGTITFSGATGGSGTYEYSINGGTSWQGSPEFTGLAAGDYVLWVRDSEDTDNYADLATVNLIVEEEPSAITNIELETEIELITEIII